MKLKKQIFCLFFIAALLFALLAGVSPPLAQAQDFPNKPIIYSIAVSRPGVRLISLLAPLRAVRKNCWGFLSSWRPRPADLQRLPRVLDGQQEARRIHPGDRHLRCDYAVAGFDQSALRSDQGFHFHRPVRERDRRTSRPCRVTNQNDSGIYCICQSPSGFNLRVFGDQQS